ncbi:MAG: hypothetical protein HXS48_20290 [Theionarchaea archaeon]|nr:hypothetical protein [Theionarchaea archaeon]
MSGTLVDKIYLDGNKASTVYTVGWGNKQRAIFKLNRRSRIQERPQPYCRVFEFDNCPAITVFPVILSDLLVTAFWFLHLVKRLEERYTFRFDTPDFPKALNEALTPV